MASAEEEQLDPRVQVELEKLNTATDDINKLEAKLEEANYVFRTTLTESTARLKALAKKLGSCIEKARPYYEAQELARSSQLECQRAAVQYQRANALHQAAKETIALAEERFVNCRHEHWQFDSAWQEMLNHATMKVMEAEAQKAASEREHMRRAAAFTQAEQRVQQLQRGLRSSINKSIVYFEEKAAITSQLEALKERVQQLQRAISASKSSYAQSLRSLEQISEEIHEQRRCKLPREPGVGAEITPPEASDAQGYDHGAKSFTPLEEMTAKEEKYWETLREKLERLQVTNQNNSSTEEEVLSDLESPDGRERTVTGSSCTSTHGLEPSAEVERIISGESSSGSESGGPQSPAESKEIFLVEDSHVLNDAANLDWSRVDGEISQESKNKFQEGSKVKTFSKKEFSSWGKTGGEDEVAVSTSEMDTRTKGVSFTKINGMDNEEIDTNLNKNVFGNTSNDLKRDNISVSENGNALPENAVSQEKDIVILDIEDENDDDDEEEEEENDMINKNANTFDFCKVKERGDGSSSPPPAMCQPVRSLSAIPESQEI